jgi:LPS export ABC transporter protein LptC
MKSKFNFIVFIFLLLISCQTQKIKLDVEAIDDDKIPTHESWNTNIKFYKENCLQALLKTSHLTDYKEEEFKLLDKVNVKFYNKKNELESILTSNFGKSDDKNKLLIAWGNVVVQNFEDKKLNTEELIWNEETGKVYSDKFVRIYDGADVIEGFGFESDKKLENYKIFKITYLAQRETKN